MALRSAISFGALVALAHGVAGGEVTTQNAELKELFENGCQTNLCETAMLCLPCNPYPLMIPDFKNPGGNLVPNPCSAANFLKGDMEVNGRPVLSGFCSEPLTIGAEKQKLNGVSYLANCKGYVQPGWRNQVNQNGAKNHPAEDYVVECREGEVTCNDGTCEKWKTSNSVIAKCFQRGFTDDVNDTDFPCNFANADMEKSIWDQFVADSAKFAPGAKNYCRKNGGVRKHPLKCSRAGGKFNGATNAGYCNAVEDGEARAQTCVQRHISDPTAVVPSWVDKECEYPCPNRDSTKGTPGCCIPESGISYCTTMELYTPVVPLTYPECTEKTRQRNCSECDDADYGLCCYKKANDVTCTNQAGLTKEKKLSACAEAVYGQSAGNERDVCTQTTPGVIEEPRQFVEGLELGFKMVKADIMEKKSDCCCSVTCSCYGDPHCTSFFGDYEFTDSNNPITYALVDDEQVQFSVTAKNGPPGGVITDIWVSYNEQPGLIGSPQKELHINADACADRTGGYEALAGMGFTDYYAAPLPAGPGSKDFFKQVNFPTVYVHASNYHVQIFCKTQKAGVSRIDIILKKDTLSLGIPVKEECCPHKEQVQQKLSHGKGFCFRENNHNYLDYFKDLGARRLEETTEERRALGDVFQLVSNSDFKNFDLPVKSAVVLPSDDEIISMAASIQSVPRASLAADLADGAATVDDLKAMTAMNDDTCERFATSALFPVDVEANKCVEGLYLQARKKGAIPGQWKNVLFFPEGANYCSDGKMYLWFKDIVFDAETGETLSSDMDIQFKTCTVDPATEGCAKRWACQETMSVEKVVVGAYLIGNSYAKAIEVRQAKAWDQCACRFNDVNAFQNCYLDCYTTGNCPGACPALP